MRSTTTTTAPRIAHARARATPPRGRRVMASADAPSTSARVRELRNEGAYAVLAKAKALEARGRDVVHLEIGQPGFATPENIARAGMRAIEGGATKYAAPDGTMELRDAVASYVARTRGVDVDADEVVVGPGAKPGLFLPTLAVVDPGDEVVFPDPGFPTYAAMVDAAGGVKKPVALRADGASFGMDALERAVNAKSKLIVINPTGGNPTGGVMPREDVERVAALARKFNCWVLSDEIYSRLIYSESESGSGSGDVSSDVSASNSATTSNADDSSDVGASNNATTSNADDASVFSIMSRPGMKSRTILVDGFSKTYCMTGWRLGWIVAPKPLAERVKLLTVHSVGCVAAFTQVAGVEALTGPQDSVVAMRDAYKIRRDYLVDALNAIPGVTCAKPAGAFYVFPNVASFGVSSQRLADYLLEDAGVALLPGTDFGANGEGHLRLSYVGDLDTLRDAVERIKTSLAKFASRP